MKIVVLVLAIIFIGSLFVFANELTRKPQQPWGTTAPCLEAIEDIAAEVNERLGEE